MKILANLSPVDAKKVVNTGLPHPWYQGGPLMDTPLHAACRSIELDFARLFVRCGASTIARNSLGKTAPDTIAHEDFVRQLLDAALMDPLELEDMLEKRQHAFEVEKKRVFGDRCETGCTLEEDVAHGVSHTAREESNPRKRIVMKLQEFGLPLFETIDDTTHKMRSRIREIPASLERILHLIERKVSSNASAAVPKLLQVLKYYPATINSVTPYVTASPGRISVNPQRHLTQAAGNVSDEELKNAVALLRKDRHESKKESEKEHKHKHKHKHGHNDHKIEPAVLMELVMQYFTTLPGPVIPSKFAATFAHLSYVNSPKAAVHQVRILYHYLPSISRLFLVRFCDFFHTVFDISNNPRNLITVSYTFAPLFFRVRDLSPSLSHDINPRALDQLASTFSVFFTNAVVENIPYFTFAVDQPVLSSFPEPSRSSKVHDFIMKATVTHEFPTPEFTSATSEPETLLRCAVGDEVRLLGYRKNDWLDGMASGRRGFIPRSCIKLNLFKSLPPGVNAPVAPSPLLASEALGAGQDDGPTGAVFVPPPPAGALAVVAQGNVSPGKNGTSLLAPKPLPRDWIEARDPQTGNVYYINTITKKSQWIRPTEQAPHTAVPPVQGGLPPGTSLLSGERCARTGNPEIDKRLADIHRAQEDLVRLQVEMNAEKEKLHLREQEFEVRTRLEQMKPTTAKPWQINYSDLVFQDVIGEGGFGQVFRATWRGTTVAVKILKQRSSRHRLLAGILRPKSPDDALNGAAPRLSPDMIDRFSQEVTILRSLHHPNLVMFMGASVAPRLCMVSEYMEGGSLYELLYKKKKVPDPKRRLVLALDIAKALAYLHNMQPQIVHRDLKSPNILLEEHGDHAKVGDVGLARVRALSGEKMTGAAGTYPWMAPEMLAGRSYTEKADVYSYGIVLAEMCSGTLPFPGLSASEVREHVCTKGERPPLPDTLTPQWTSLVHACWSQADTKRPSFIEVINLLQEIGSSRKPK